jgi:hypothetical protein
MDVAIATQIASSIIRRDVLSILKKCKWGKF